jgi:hypothetical protein
LRRQQLITLLGINGEFASGIAKGSTPIHAITERRSLFPSSSTRTHIDSPYGLSSQPFWSDGRVGSTFSY